MTDPKDELGARFDDRRADKEPDEANNKDNMSNTSDSGVTSNTHNTSNKPGPDPDENATRNRRQVPMYLPDEKADELNTLYEKLDGRSKVAGEGAIEKHADFMEALVEFAVENEDELATRLGIDQD
jgi:hypothetical protein